MDASRFDALARTLSGPGSRRRVLALLAMLPALGGLLPLIQPEDADAKERRRRRKQRHKRRKARRNRDKGCRPKNRRKVCAGRCGTVKNRKTCGKRIDCGPCDCDPPCQSPTPTCVDGTCTGCTSHTECGSDALCVDGACHACDVTCNAGTPADCGADLQKAFSGSKDTLYVCPGSYEGGFSMSQAITVIGAGAAQTILDGNDARQVLRITADVPVTLRALTVTRGMEINGDPNPGAGIYTIGDLTLTDAVVSRNHATSANSAGGGIYSTSSLTLRNTVVRENSGRYGGGVHINGGSLTLESGSSVEENDAEDLVSMEPGFGGGIYTHNSVVMLQSGSRVTGNTATSEGGAILIYDSVVMLQRGSRIIGNTATVDGGAMYYYQFASGSSITVEDGAVICENSGQQCAGTGEIDGDCPTSDTCPA